MNIEMVPIDSIVPWDKNPRAITDEALAGLMDSVKKFGMPEPIIANRTTGRIVGGHQRHKVAILLGWKEVPVIWVSLSEVEEAALNVTLNNPHISGYYTDSAQDIIKWIAAEIPDYHTTLRLDRLEIPNPWEGQPEKIEAIEENLDGITSVIKVFCPQEAKERVKDAITQSIGHWERVSII